MHRDLTDWLFALCVGVLCVGITMILRPSLRRVSLALVLGLPVFATMGVLLGEFISSALTHSLLRSIRVPVHTFVQLTRLVPRVGGYLGATVGSLFALWLATPAFGTRGLRVRGPLAYCFFIAMVAAIGLFCWIGIPGYLDLRAHQPPPNWRPGDGPFPPGTSSEPPWYALVVAGYLASQAFVVSFAILALVVVTTKKILAKHHSDSVQNV
jgi:hypothetical protein